MTPDENMSRYQAMANNHIGSTQALPRRINIQRRTAASQSPSKNQSSIAGITLDYALTKQHETSVINDYSYKVVGSASTQ
jgi:hypothetical protein